MQQPMSVPPGGLATLRVASLPSYITPEEFRRVFSSQEGFQNVNLTREGPGGAWVGYATFGNLPQAHSCKTAFSGWNGWGQVLQMDIVQPTTVGVKRNREGDCTNLDDRWLHSASACHGCSVTQRLSLLITLCPSSCLRSDEQQFGKQPGAGGVSVQEAVQMALPGHPSVSVDQHLVEFPTAAGVWCRRPARRVHAAAWRGPSGWGNNACILHFHIPQHFTKCHFGAASCAAVWCSRVVHKSGLSLGPVYRCLLRHHLTT